MKTDTPEKLRPFTFHGLSLAWDSNQAEGDCPFCGKAAHFYANPKTGQWDCKACGEAGNIPTFLRLLYEGSVRVTDPKDFRLLAEDRGISKTALRAWGLAKSLITGDWLLPTYNPEGKLANLHRASSPDYRPLGSPGCKVWPFGTALVNKRHKTLWVCEGPWDGIALWSALQGLKAKGPALIRTTDPARSLGAAEGVIAVPGASTFSPDWAPWIEGRAVRLVYDSDPPRKTKTGRTVRAGWDGMIRVARILGDLDSPQKSLSRLRWGKEGFDPDLPPGYDLRDLIRDRGPSQALQTVLERLEAVKVSQDPGGSGTAGGDGSGDGGPSLEPIPRDSFRELCRDYASRLHFSPMMRDTLITMLAVAVSTGLGGDQLWLRVIGPPGSGKTTLAEALTPSPHCFPLDIFTGGASGYKEHARGRPKRRGRDASLIPAMKGKTTVIKDGDTLLSSPHKDRILGELRALYDGALRAHYRNFETRIFEGVRTTLILCGTDDLRTLNRSSLGERFLDCEILGTEEADPYLARAIHNTYLEVTGSLVNGSDPDHLPEDAKTYLARVTMGYLDHLKESLPSLTPPVLPPRVEARIKSLGQLMAVLRARVRREAKDTLTYRPRAELATRLVSQLVKLAVCLAIVLQKKTIDSEVLRIVCKVALDTASGFHLEIAQLLIRYPRGLSSQQIALGLDLSETSVRRHIADMSEFRILTRQDRPNNSGIGGRNLHLWFLSKTVRRLWKESGLKRS